MKLTEKYRPQRVEDLVLPPDHRIQAALQYVANPDASAFLFYGRSGVGKTSLARLMAVAAARHEMAITCLVGPDLDSMTVREIARTCAQPPLFGHLHAFLVNESDGIPAGGQLRLLEVLENLRYSAWFFTSNEDLESFEPRFLSRLIPQAFSTQGLFGPATDWLLSVAAKESIQMTRPAAERIIRENKSNLRASLQSLENLKASALRPVFKASAFDIRRNKPKRGVKQASNLPIITALLDEPAATSV